MMAPDTSSRPANVSKREHYLWRLKAIRFLEDRRFSKNKPFTTGDVNVPGWVLGELWEERLIQGGKKGPDQPNLWWI